MNPSDQLEDKLLDVQLQHPKTLWISESEFPVDVVRRDWHTIHGKSWKRQDDGYEQAMLNAAMNSGDPGLQAYAKILMGRKGLFGIKRQTSKKAISDVYILVKMGLTNVGIKFKVVET